MTVFARLLRNERGNSFVELGLVAPLLAAMLIGMVDISRAYSAKLQIEQSAQRAIEKVQQYNTSDSTYNTLKTEAASAARAAGFTAVLDTDVTIDYWLECNGTRQADYNTVCPSGQAYARWITLDIPAKFTPMFSSRRWPGSNTDGTYTIHGKAGLRTQ